MAGKLDGVNAGELFRKGDEVRVPLKCSCLDPLKRVREVRVDVWAGKPTDTYAASSKLALVLPKDTVRQTYKMNYENEYATLDVILPKLTEGQVAWVQPVLVMGKESRWSEPHSYDASLAVEREPTDLIAKFPGAERTVHLTTDLTIAQGKEKIFSRAADLDILESLGADSRGRNRQDSFWHDHSDRTKGRRAKSRPRRGKFACENCSRLPCRCHQQTP